MIVVGIINWDSFRYRGKFCFGKKRHGLGLQKFVIDQVGCIISGTKGVRFQCMVTLILRVEKPKILDFHYH